MPSDIKEKGFESLVTNWLIQKNEYEKGKPDDFDPRYAIDREKLRQFIELNYAAELKKYSPINTPNKTEKFLIELDKEIARRGVIDILRKGFKYYPIGEMRLFNPLPTDQNARARAAFGKNIFSVTRQIHYSPVNKDFSIDIIIFINGLPVITIEVKNEYTNQTYKNAIHQYSFTRHTTERLFKPGRCAVHFALDENECWMCAQLADEESEFRPFNRGVNKGAGNPIVPNGLKTEYLWKEILTKESLADILTNYAQKVRIENNKTHETTIKDLFPRYHQLDVVRKLLEETKHTGLGKRYLIQHSAGSGKSNSIAWLSYQLVNLERDGEKLFDSVLVVTDRINLDTQIKNTIAGFSDKKLSNIFAHANSSSDLEVKLADGKRLIISTIHKFPKMLEKIQNDFSNKKFAIVIDEAHSSQSGRMSAEMNIVLSTKAPYYPGNNINTDEPDIEDIINEHVEKRKMLKNACYYAFTATPKKKTLETFGTEKQIDGEIQYLPFHEYTMKQAIEENYILDVLQNFITVKSYYSLLKTCADDPKYDNKKAQKILRSFAETREYTISQKAKIIVDHFVEEVDKPKKIKGQAKAMVVSRDIESAISYYFEIKQYIAEQHLPYEVIVAFSGEKKYGDEVYNEAKLNGFPSKDIEDTFKLPQYRFLIVADKFQTGYDEPLLHTMYVDKSLSDVKAVQTLSRLNRTCHNKFDTIVVDFYNKPEDIQAAFARYYQTTLLCGQTDPQKLNNLIDEIEAFEIYTKEQVEEVVVKYFLGKSREEFQYILDDCVLAFEHLNLDDKIKYKKNVRTFIKTYNFLASILPFGQVDWEKLSIFLSLLVNKLHVQDIDYTKGILQDVELAEYRAEKQQAIKLILENEDAELKPDSVHSSKGREDPEMEPLTVIIDDFHKRFAGAIQFENEAKEMEMVKELPDIVFGKDSYRNALKNSDKENIRLESNSIVDDYVRKNALEHLEFYKAYTQNQDFRQWILNMVFISTYNRNIPLV